MRQREHGNPPKTVVAVRGGPGAAGEFLGIIAAIRCPVIAIHGDYDPHPAEGVEIPLRSKLPRSSFVLLERCGHKPWQEVHAREAFHRELEKAIS